MVTKLHNRSKQSHFPVQIHHMSLCLLSIRPYFFLILGLRIFFQNIKVGGGKKIKIKIYKKIFFYLI